MRSLLIILVATFFVSVANTDDCQAQLFGTRRVYKSRAVSLGPSPGPIRTYVPQTHSARPEFPIEDYYTPRRPKVARILDGPMTHKYRNPAEVDSRYVGGFHQSHFHNIGIPSGDIGIRGNTYNWNTW